MPHRSGFKSDVVSYGFDPIALYSPIMANAGIEQQAKTARERASIGSPLYSPARRKASPKAGLSVRMTFVRARGAPKSFECRAIPPVRAASGAHIFFIFILFRTKFYTCKKKKSRYFLIEALTFSRNCRFNRSKAIVVRKLLKFGYGYAGKFLKLF